MDVRLGGTWVSPSQAYAYVSGSWRLLNYAEAYVSGSWRRVATFVQALSVSISPSSIAAVNTSQTTNVTATPTGGLGPYTYAWTLVSNSGVTGPQISSPSTASTQFYGTPTNGSNGQCVFRCTVTDSLGSTAHADITVTFAIVATGGP